MTLPVALNRLKCNWPMALLRLVATLTINPGKTLRPRRAQHVTAAVLDVTRLIQQLPAITTQNISVVMNDMADR
eukprot:Skav229091  [mRNA]  locus=scaffold92:117062:117879:- [translate_table: standard]